MYNSSSPRVWHRSLKDVLGQLRHKSQEWTPGQPVVRQVGRTADSMTSSSGHPIRSTPTNMGSNCVASELTSCEQGGSVVFHSTLSSLWKDNLQDFHGPQLQQCGLEIPQIIWNILPPLCSRLIFWQHLQIPGVRQFLANITRTWTPTVLLKGHMIRSSSGNAVNYLKSVHIQRVLYPSLSRLLPGTLLQSQPLHPLGEIQAPSIGIDIRK